MDQFGVLVESIGFKSQVKSAPLADLKGKNDINNGFPRNLGYNSDFNTKPSSNSANGSFVDDFGGVFGSNNTLKTQNLNGFDDVFGGSNMYDFDSVFKGFSNSGAKSSASGFYDKGDDIFGGFPDPGSMNFGNMTSTPKQDDSIDDLIGSFGDIGSKPNGLRKHSGNMEKNGSEFNDDLIPGFGGSSPSSNGAKSETSHSRHSSDHSAKCKILVEDPFKFFESSSSQRNSTSALISDPLDQGARKSSIRSSIDELEDFATGRMPNDANEQSDVRKDRAEARFKHVKEVREKKNTAKQESVSREQKETGKTRVQTRVGEERQASGNENDLEKIFSMGAKPMKEQSPRSTTEDSVYDALFQKSRGSPVQKPSSGTSSTSKKTSPVKNMDDDFSFLFGVGVTPSSGEFQEVEGESEDRRRARLNHHQRTQERMAKALNEKNQRDLQAQREQEERHRLAATLDDDIKRWAAGKEGNMRALLSSLQYVLWPECGWRPVSLTDLITSISVKKVYQKATLSVHPDKVQQKGANLQQKYIAEKVFDILKEAWNKFSSEEL